MRLYIVHNLQNIIFIIEYTLKNQGSLEEEIIISHIISPVLEILEEIYHFMIYFEGKIYNFMIYFYIRAYDFCVSL